MRADSLLAQIPLLMTAHSHKSADSLPRKKNTRNSHHRPLSSAVPSGASTPPSSPPPPTAPNFLTQLPHTNDPMRRPLSLASTHHSAVPPPNIDTLTCHLFNIRYLQCVHHLSLTPPDLAPPPIPPHPSTRPLRLSLHLSPSPPSPAAPPQHISPRSPAPFPPPCLHKDLSRMWNLFNAPVPGVHPVNAADKGHFKYLWQSLSGDGTTTCTSSPSPLLVHSQH